MSRSLSATDQTMAEYFAALMSEVPPSAASMVTEVAQPVSAQLNVPAVAASPAPATELQSVAALKPLPARQPYTAAAAALTAEQRADAEMLARYEAQQAVADDSAEARANAEMLALYGATTDAVAQSSQPSASPVAVTRSSVSARMSPLDSPPLAVRNAQPVEKLLAQVSAVQREVLPQILQPPAEELSNLQCILEESGLQELASQIIPPPPASPVMLDDEEFQTLYFEVAGLTLAVPLRHLGGIYRIERINKLIGKPDWFMGVMNHRDASLHVVDSARWVMPEKYSPQLAASLNYQYLIVLGDSPWGLACERLLTATAVRREAVKWREQPGRRPWLAGLVIDRMCALINVSALIAQLSAGDDNR